MSKKCQVRSLSDWSLSELANTIVASIGLAIQTDIDDISITIVELNTYLEESGATSVIYQDLLRIILSSDYLEASVRFTCLQMLLNESVNCLITEIFPFSYYEKILQVIAAQGLGLNVLNLKGVWIKDDHLHLMMEITKKLTKLKNLSIPYIANDDLLKEISENIPKLKYLDISGETDITEIGIECLTLGECRYSLTIVDIGMMGEENICHTDVALLLTELPNLANLGTYSYVGKSLLYIMEQKDKHFKCKLKHLHDTGTDLKTIEAIVSTCPVLESVYIDTPVEEGILIKLNSLKLSAIKLYKFFCYELMDLLELMGKNLISMTCIKGKGQFDFGKLTTLCPNIVYIDVYMMEHLKYSTDVGFPYLKGLEILNSPIGLTNLKHLISRSLKIKRLAVDTVQFTDEDMAR